MTIHYEKQLASQKLLADTTPNRNLMIVIQEKEKEIKNEWENHSLDELLTFNIINTQAIREFTSTLFDESIL